MGILITLDGVDGTGKSTVAQLLAVDGGYHYYKTPSGRFEQLRSEIDGHATPLERYCFYRLATQLDSTQLREIVKSSSVVCDRYIASTLAYHLVMDLRILGIHNNEQIVIPDFAFLLLVESRERDRRLNARAGITSDGILEHNSGFLDQVQETFRSLNALGYLPFALIPVDTTGKTPSEVTAEIQDAINNRR